VSQNWDKLEGADAGQTHVDHPDEGEMAVWAHPVDLHYVCKVRPCVRARLVANGSHRRTSTCAPSAFSWWCSCHLPQRHCRGALTSRQGTRGMVTPDGLTAWRMSQGLTGWPKLHFQVWCQDQHGRTDLCECRRRSPRPAPHEAPV